MVQKIYNNYSALVKSYTLVKMFSKQDSEFVDILVDKRSSMNFENRWVLRSALNFASDEKVVREIGREFQREGPEKAKAASAREQDMEIYEKRKGHQQLDEQQSYLS
ncbi:hypothetical protein HELRODRAFT_158630 [Helobdella robusta]|uniref:Uncharacterized protein n=1 Tax=Helobdella robusta TaxID=6412 RepID=T1EN15_HELRO|nr:hypothetical protein HELRODRAFT_158630 [Helobdella robusta]ESO12167.1 hypothetical protein HELRODRAFT_158630 [Helobdella robusta]